MYVIYKRAQPIDTIRRVILLWTLVSGCSVTSTRSLAWPAGQHRVPATVTAAVVEMERVQFARASGQRRQGNSRGRSGCPSKPVRSCTPAHHFYHYIYIYIYIYVEFNSILCTLHIYINLYEYIFVSRWNSADADTDVTTVVYRQITKLHYKCWSTALRSLQCSNAFLLLTTDTFFSYYLLLF